MKKILIILFLLVGLVAAAQDHYIATAANGGSNSNSGTISSPWLTLTYACANATTSGDIIHVGSGTFTETSQSNLAIGVSIVGEGNTSIIRSTTLTSEDTPILNLISASVANGNQSVSYLYFDGVNTTAGKALEVQNRHNVKVHHCTFINFAWQAVGWRATDTQEDVAPAVYLTGAEFYNNTVTNCSRYSGWGRGALFCGGLTGMLIYDNVMTETGRAAGTQGWPIKFWYWGGWMRGCKIYNNTITASTTATWPFAIEGVHHSGIEIYNNNIIGEVDLNNVTKSTYSYGASIHDNTIGPATVTGSVGAITLEFEMEDVYVERNVMRNTSAGVLFTPRSDNWSGVYIRCNLFQNIYPLSYYSEAIRVIVEPPNSMTMTNVFIQNNVFYANAVQNLTDAIVMVTGDGAYSVNNMRIENNIFINWDDHNINLNGGSFLSNVYIRNNLSYLCGNSNAPLISGGTPTNYVYQNNIVGSDPLLTSTTDFHLQAGSPAINSGIGVGLTLDYDGNAWGSPPSIGAYEYGIGINAPTLTTTAITGITNTSATSGGNITSAGGGTVTARGVCWNTSTNPTLSNSYSVNGSGIGSYSSTLTPLSPSTTYYVRAYATNESGTGYGANVSFATIGTPSVPNVARYNGKRIKLNGKFVTIR